MPLPRLLSLAALLLLAVASPAAEPRSVSPGEKPEVTLFGLRGRGTKIVYVLDRSGSMGGPGGKALAAAKAELIASMEKIDALQQFQIVVYNERPKAFNPTGPAGRLAFGSEQNKAEVRKFLASVEAEGGTDHESALATAIHMRPDVIFLMTDGDDPKLSARQLERIDRIGPGIMINTIEFGPGPQKGSGNWLVRLARQSGGESRYIDTTKLESPERK